MKVRGWVLIQKFDPVEFSAGQLSLIFFLRFEATMITAWIIFPMSACQVIGMDIVFCRRGRWLRCGLICVPGHFRLLVIDHVKGLLLNSNASIIGILSSGSRKMPAPGKEEEKPEAG